MDAEQPVGPWLRHRVFSHEEPGPSGWLVKTGIIEALRLSVTEAAQALRITRAALSTFLNERASRSPDSKRCSPAILPLLI